MIEEAPSVTEDDRAAWRRTLVGKSTALWAPSGQHEVRSGWWKSLSGAPSAGFNVVLCHGEDPGLVRTSIETVGAAGKPALITLAGPAVANAQVLGDAGWVCVGAIPVMVLPDISGYPVDVVETEKVARVSRASAMPKVWDLVAASLGHSPALARLAVPEATLLTPGQSVWTLSVGDEVRACVTLVVVEQSVMVWSMGTDPTRQRRGYGRRLLTAAFEELARTGVTESILLATPEGEPFYKAMGYDLAEYWQLWSRPRWVLGRS